MITNVSMNRVNPTFGFAKLSETAKQSAAELGVERNEFVNADLFKKKSALKKELATGKDFSTICEEYGCSRNGITNAKFIRTHVLSTKGQAVKGMNEEDYSAIMRNLFQANYDNPELKSFETKMLLEKAKAAMAPQEYTVAAGLLHKSK